MFWIGGRLWEVAAHGGSTVLKSDHMSESYLVLLTTMLFLQHRCLSL